MLMCPLAKINNWVGLGANNFLFDNIFIFENYPVEQKAKEGGADMSITCLPSLSSETPAMNEQTEFPLILGITPLEKLRFSMSYREDLFSKNEITQLGNHLINILESFIQNANGK
jgi:non-ribosomal peptide synthetase component F